MIPELIRLKDLLRADLDSAVFDRADLSGAILDGASFDNANLNNANLINASGAAFLSEGIFCNTTMPDASIRNDGCSEIPEVDTIPQEYLRSAFSRY